MASSNKLVVHLDVDSPRKLLNFYKIKGIEFDDRALDEFYKKAWERAMDFFGARNIRTTFFVVGDELEHSSTIQDIIRKAHKAGHEIENHTYSHPYGLAKLSESEITSEISKCNDIVKSITGERTVGFRSPGYSISTQVINVLEKLGFEYDSSGFWSIMNPILKLSHKILFKNGVSSGDFGSATYKLSQKAYVPHPENWLVSSTTKRNIIELPLPRTNLFGMPFYNNFNLWTPSFYSNFMSKTLKKENMIYLFHLIEFMDLSDNIPRELEVHPNVKIPVSEKLKRSAVFLTALLERYEATSTRNLIAGLSANSK